MKEPASDQLAAYVCLHTLLKIKELHDAIEEPFCLNGSLKSL